MRIKTALVASSRLTAAGLCWPLVRPRNGPPPVVPPRQGAEADEACVARGGVVEDVLVAYAISLAGRQYCVPTLLAPRTPSP